MTLVITNGKFYTYTDGNGKFIKTEDLSKAERFVSLPKAVDYIKGHKARTSGYFVYDLDTNKICYRANIYNNYRRKTYSQTTRKMIYNKADGRCALCGKPVKLEDMTVDHIKPLAMGGGNDVENLQCTCSACNLFKGSVLPEDFFEKITEIYMYQLERKLGKGIKWKVVQCILGK